MKNTAAVLFDLDGTMLDTARDLLYALNQLRQEHNRSALSLADIRPMVSQGSKTMLKFGLDIDENHTSYQNIRNRFLTLYEEHIIDSTQFFPNMDKVLTNLEERFIPWGIVTNRLTHYTIALLKALQIDHRPVCIVCGDTLPKSKPDPAPILHACQQLKKDPKHCIYVGDAVTDVLASKAAGAFSLVALYGYIDSKDDPYSWEADGYIKDPLQILDWIE